MAGNFGIGLGAFMQGVQGGAQTYANITDLQSKQKLRDQAMADNDQLRQISSKGIADAKANTDGQIDNVTNYYMKNIAPQLQEHFLSTGEVDKANAYGDFMQKDSTQRGMKASAQAMRAAQMGDADGFAKNLQEAYNHYLPDSGLTITGSKVVRDDKGNATGLQITTKGADGKESTQDYNGMEDVYKQFSSFAAPDKVFEYGQQQLQQAAKTRADAAKDGRELNQKLQLGQINQGYDLEKQNNGSMLKRAEEAEKTKLGGGTKVNQDYQAKAALLKQQGYSDEYIAKMTPSLIGIQNQAKPMSSRIEDYIKVQMANDITGEFGKLSTAEQAKRATQAIGEIDTQANSSMGQAGGVSLPGVQQGQTQGQGTGIPFYDTKTNSIVYR